MGPNGERLKRGQWSEPVEGDLTIVLGRDNFVAKLERLDVERRHQVLYPIGDVRVQTFDQGLLVIGYGIVPETPTREVRQAWYCVPAPNLRTRECAPNPTVHNAVLGSDQRARRSPVQRSMPTKSTLE